MRRRAPCEILGPGHLSLDLRVRSASGTLSRSILFIIAILPAFEGIRYADIENALIFSRPRLAHRPASTQKAPMGMSPEFGG